MYRLEIHYKDIGLKVFTDNNSDILLVETALGIVKVLHKRKVYFNYYADAIFQKLSLGFCHFAWSDNIDIFLMKK